MPRIAALDFGRKRIGVAITDERKIIASPLFVQEATNSLKETALALKEKLSQHMPLEKIVLGLPLHLNGEESDTSILVKKFGAILEETLSVSVDYWDERLTSQEVERMMKEAQVKRKRRAELSDCMAATLILQNYLEAHGTFYPRIPLCEA